ncbi:hypothetical protein D9M72_492390 [compost metagenome]
MPLPFVAPADRRVTPRALTHACAGGLALCSLALGIGVAARGACVEARQAAVRNASLSTLAPIMQRGSEGRGPRGHGACKAGPALSPAAARS